MTESENTRLDRIETLLEGLHSDMEGLRSNVDNLRQEVEKTNIRVETYQKASTQVVNLAFGLIFTSALAIIIPAVLSR